MHEVLINTGNKSEKGARMKKLFTNLIVLIIAVVANNSYSAGFNGIKTITLNQDQLKKVGVTVYNDRIEAFASEKIKLVIRNDKIDVLNNFRDKPQTGLCCPRFVVNTTKKGTVTYYHRIGDYYALKSNRDTEELNINGLICVRIDAVLAGRKGISGNSVYLWYDCTEEIIKLLPTYTKVELMAELFDSSGVISEEHNFTDISRSKGGALSDVSIRPNPVYGETGELGFSLTERRNIDISMYDISGSLRKTIAAGTAFGSGSHSLRLDLDGFPDGMYIIVITSGNNERITQRLIKTR